ncbi:UNVERIFIED_CONTAM: hypothetical protein K2H54_011852 [Gekko kuhli]
MNLTCFESGEKGIFQCLGKKLSVAIGEGKKLDWNTNNYPDMAGFYEAVLYVKQKHKCLLGAGNIGKISTPPPKVRILPFHPGSDSLKYILILVFNGASV